MLLTKDTAIYFVNLSLDDARRVLEAKNDTELAAQMGVSPKQISFWRNGRWASTDTALIRMLITALLPRVLVENRTETSTFAT